jgi:eukaryotic-like serine/threonine-protein kinase
LGADHIPVGVTTDVYGLGALLYHLLTGRPPFVGATTAGVIRQVQERQPLPPRELNPIVPGALEQICLKCLEKDPRNRYATVAELIADLQAFLDDQPIRARALPLWKRGARVVQRNQGLVAITFVLGLLALGTMSAAIVLALRTYSDTRERAEFDAARETADRWRSYGRTLQGAMEALGRHDTMARANCSKLLPPRSGAGNIGTCCDARIRVWWYGPIRTRSEAVFRRWHLVPTARSSQVQRRMATWFCVNLRSGDVLGARANHTLQINSVSFSPNGRRILTSGNDGKAAIIDAATLESLAILEGHKGEVTGAAFLQDGERCITTGIDGSIRVWNSRGEQLNRWEFGDHGEGILSLEVGPDGRMVAIGTQGRLKIFSAEDGKVISQWQAHRGRALSVAWNASGDRLASSGEEGDVFIWDAATGNRLLALARGPGRTMRLAWSPDGKRVAGACYQGEVRLWSTSSGKVEECCVGHQGIVTAVAFTPDGRVVSAGYDRTLRFWALGDSPGGSTLRTEGDLRTTAFALGPEGKWIARGDVPGECISRRFRGGKM